MFPLENLRLLQADLDVRDEVDVCAEAVTYLGEPSMVGGTLTETLRVRWRWGVLKC